MIEVLLVMSKRRSQLMASLPRPSLQK